jgi:hypothetical protein
LLTFRREEEREEGGRKERVDGGREKGKMEEGEGGTRK